MGHERNKSLVVFLFFANLYMSSCLTYTPIVVENHDFVVIGGGSAGGVVAGVLAEHNLPGNKTWKVALLDQGLFVEDLPDPQVVRDADRENEAMKYGPIELNYTTTVQEDSANRTLGLARAQGFGGCHNHNSMYYRVGAPEAYNNWNTTGWSYADLLPSINATRNRLGVRYMSTTVPQHDYVKSVLVASSGYPLVSNEAPKVGTFIGVQDTLYSIVDVNATYHTRKTSFDSYVKESPAFGKNLKVFPGIKAQRIVLDFFGRAIGVISYDTVNQRIVYFRANKEVIVSGGVFDSPKLLMRSGIGNRADLLKAGVLPLVQNKNVGKNLKYHMAAVQMYLPAPNWSMAPYTPKMKQLSNVLVGLAIRPEGNNATHIGDHVNAMLDIQQNSEFIPGLTIVSFVGLNMRDFGPGEVKLNKYNLDVPVVDPKLYENPDDLELSVQTFEEMNRLASLLTPNYMVARLYPPADVQTREQIRAFMKGNISDGSHAVGTCRMGNDADSVVDPQLRVRGVSRLRVIDASVAPTTPLGNTNAMAIAIGHRGAQLIISSY
ncbi:Glucose-methanol-choline oxidoreductase [Orpheovirus IHUMI-LCC2]|uniref:Glucose-methanol-choline oxidoreductase n=1 Tax=Orpheovirus IHUMI-LCC2 TaxID=2023057 RepID=A0A2I2L3D3_9VIRU|nr:Glucose-methanol-choline oxidoreductase [Orpheovirus IHUMI-LCC2]SNW62033.1 Glucose-methanol-choline oxidoreductase [Orpheovirus IHUMI-LCC2]